MSICFTVLTDGRKHYIKEALPSWVNLYSDIDNNFIIDDSGDAEYRDWLSNTFPSFNIIPVGSNRMGYDIAMQKLFSLVKELKVDYCFHTEDDFILHKQFDINNLIEILQSNKGMAQISLMRQPWYHNENEHGGVIEAIKAHNKHAIFSERKENELEWTQHQAYWTCNPHLFPAWLTNFEWPSGPWSESRFGREIFATYRFAGVYGNKNNWPYVEHIGRERYGKKY
jgi:hypothetical protein